MHRRQALLTLPGLAALAALPRLALADSVRQATVGAAWRGPNKGDPYFAGALVADWETRKLGIRYALPLPTRPHGLLAEADGGLLAVGVRPGTWLLRCDGEGRVTQQVRIDEETSTRLNGHAVVSARGDAIYTTETDLRSGRGRIGVRDRLTLRKLAEWDTHGIDPHQLLIDHAGHLIVANGGVPRTPEDKKYDLHRMESSLVRLDGASGRLLGQWRLDDPRLSLRHLAWSRTPAEGNDLLGIALQAEHDEAAARATAPILAVFDGERLTLPTRANDGIGYAGDIAAAHHGGFALSSNQAGRALLWHPGAADKLFPIVDMQEAYALAPWHGPGRGGGALVATALGLVRWHPQAPAQILSWPQPMALDNHWVLIGET
jgi:hypothetical protein